MRIISNKEYRAALARIEELLPLVDDTTPLDDRNLIELDLLSGLVADYEDIYYPIGCPSLKEIIKIRMEEMNLTPSALASLLETNLTWVNNFLCGKSVPSFRTAQNISLKLNIDGNIVLGGM